MSKPKAEPANDKLTDLPSAPLSDAESGEVRGGKKMKDLESEDRLGNFEIQR
jgi:hypothetical protein